MFGTTAYGSPDTPDKPGHEDLSGEDETRTDKDTPLKGVLLSGRPYSRLVPGIRVE